VRHVFGDSHRYYVDALDHYAKALFALGELERAAEASLRASRIRDANDAATPPAPSKGNGDVVARVLDAQRAARRRLVADALQRIGRLEAADPAVELDEAHERGIARSDMTHMTMCMLSGVSEMKSQKLSCADWAWGNPRSGSCFTAWTRSGNLIGSWMKNTGMLLPTRSQLPRCVYSLTAKPRTSRARSKDPLLPIAVEKRTNAAVTSPAR